MSATARLRFGLPIVIAVLASAFASPLPARAGGTLPTVAAKVDVGISAGQVATNTATGRTYVTSAFGGPDIKVIDDNNAVVGTLSGVPCGGAIAANPATNKVYVTDGCGPTTGLYVFDGATDEPLGSFEISDPNRSSLRGMVVDPRTDRLYVLNAQTADVIVVDLASEAVVETIAVPRPEDATMNGIALDLELGHLYVTTNDGSYRPGILTVINTATNSVITQVPTRVSPGTVAVNTETHRVFVATDYQYLQVFDGQSFELLTEIEMGNPAGVASIDELNRIYVADGAYGRVQVVNALTNTLVGTVDLGSNTYRVSTNPLNGRIYVSMYNSQQVAVLQDAFDDVAPVVSGTPDRQPNAADWYKSPVTVSWSSVDPIPSSGTPTQPANTTAATDGADVTYESGESCDPAQNCARGSVTLSIDQVVPSITYAVSPGPNGNGWHRTPVTVTFDCDDALSGLAACTDPVSLNSEGANQSAVGSAVDVAGNTTNTTVQNIDIDLTAPVVTAPVLAFTVGGSLGSVDAASTVPVTVSWTWSDALSGRDSWRLDRRVAGTAAWSEVARGAAPVSRANTTVAMSKSYEFRVVVRDRADNVATAVSVAASKVLYVDDERPTAIAYPTGKWTSVKAGLSFLGTATYTTQAGASATWAFPDSQIAYVAPVDAGRGDAVVTVTRTNGTSASSTVSLSGPAQPRAIVFAHDFGPDGAKPKHSISVRNADGRQIHLDAFLVIR